MKKTAVILGGFLALVVLVGAGCGGAKRETTADTTQPSADTVPAQPAANPAPAAANAVMIEEYAFKPAKLTVKKGTTVTWTNKDQAKHTVTGKNGGPASQLFGQNETYSYTFDTVGTFDYICEPHPYMTGSVEVTE